MMEQKEKGTSPKRVRQRYGSGMLIAILEFERVKTLKIKGNVPETFLDPSPQPGNVWETSHGVSVPWTGTHGLSASPCFISFMFYFNLQKKRQPAHERATRDWLTKISNRAELRRARA
ncbi:hypothetical protein HanRHA438_Chr17g0826901 [Helianthus annuus]|nr:hypothetical protein HanRHA438_Chr17g0826901 [Helianthus annuus]